MDVALAPHHPRFGRGPPPSWFVESFRERLATHADEIEGVQLRAQVDNTISSSSFATRRGARATISIDWAQVERSSAFSDYFWSVVGRKNAASQLTEYLVTDLMLLSARNSAIHGEYLAAREQLRLARARQEDLPTANLDRAGRATLHAAFILAHEIGHQVARERGSLVADSFDEFQETYPKLVQCRPLLAEELYCDRFAIETVLASVDLEKDPSAIAEIALLMTHLELATVVSISGHLKPGRATALGQTRGVQLLSDRVYRSHQATNLFRRAYGAQDSRRALGFTLWTHLHRALLGVLEEAMIEGFTKASTWGWGDDDYVTKIVQGPDITPEEANTILADLRS